MATNQNDPDRPVIEDLGSGEPDHGDTAAEVPNPEQLAQENREMRAKMGAMEEQMMEMMGMLQALRNGTAAENPAVTAGVDVTLPPPNPEAVAFAHTSGTNNQSPPAMHGMPWGLPPGYTPSGVEANAGNNPSRVAEQVQPTPAVINGGTRTPRVQVQIPIPQGTLVGFHSPAVIHSQIPGPVPGNTTQGRPTLPPLNNYHKNCPDKKRTTFDPIPMSYTDLFKCLFTNNLINTRPMRPVQPPYFRDYNPNVTCAFHEGAVGHTVENCKAFKSVVQDMINARGITFKQEDPSITTNPLPGHQRHATNAIHDMGTQSSIRTVECIQTPLKVIHAELCKFGVIERGCTQKGVCADDDCDGACKAFKTVLQDLLSRHTTQIGVQEYKDGHGLGYRPTQADKKRMAEEKWEKRSAKLQRREPNLKEVLICGPSPSIPVCDIRQSFVSAGLLDHNQIAVIGNGSGAEEGETGLVRRCLAGEKLKNGEVAAFPVVFNST